MIGTIILIAMMATIYNQWPNLLLVYQVIALHSDSHDYVLCVSSILPFNKSRTRAILRIGRSSAPTCFAGPHNMAIAAGNIKVAFANHGFFYLGFKYIIALVNTRELNTQIPNLPTSTPRIMA